MSRPKIPDPLVQKDVDLRGFSFMPLDIVRLQRSKQWLLARNRPEIGIYSLNLWMASWHEIPAASLENDDDVLAALAGCSPDQWAQVKEQVLRNWILCSDGRLYHPVVAEKANDAWGMKRQNKNKTSKARNTRLKNNQALKDGGNPEKISVTEPVTENVTEEENLSDGSVTMSVTSPTRQDRTGQDKIIESSMSTIGVLPSGREPSPPDPVPQRTAQPHLDDDVDFGKLARKLQDFRGGLSASTAKTRLNGWLRALSPEEINEALDHCRSQGFDRNGVRTYIDTSCQSAMLKKITDANAERAAAKAAKLLEPKQKHPDWVAVMEEIISVQPDATTWLRDDVVHTVAVNGTSVTFGIGTRFLAGHVEKVYGEKIAAAWQARNPAITEFRYMICQPTFGYVADKAEV